MYFSRFCQFSKYSDKILVFHEEFDPLESYLSSFTAQKTRRDQEGEVEIYASVSTSRKSAKNIRKKNSVLKIKLNAEKFQRRFGSGNISVPDVRLIYP